MGKGSIALGHFLAGAGPIPPLLAVEDAAADGTQI